MKDGSQESLLTRINALLATRITLLVGSIWAFYAFVIFGLTPLVWPQYEEQILYWSNFLQLIFLPVITVGTAIISRSTEQRAEMDHQAIQKEFALLRDAHDILGRSMREHRKDMRELLARSSRDNHAADHAR